MLYRGRSITLNLPKAMAKQVLLDRKTLHLTHRYLNMLSLSENQRSRLLQGDNVALKAVCNNVYRPRGMRLYGKGWRSFKKLRKRAAAG